MHIVVANPRGFCAGVERAIRIVERALDDEGGPVYVRHEIVHNRHVVQALQSRGAVFVEALSAIPSGARTVFSAHGVARAVDDEAGARGLRVLDATCPLVTKVHQEVARQGRAGRSVVLIGHAGHPEVDGTLGHFKPAGLAQIHLIASIADAESVEVVDPQQVAYATQTTLSVDDTARILAVLKRRFPALLAPKQDDICYATQNRQAAARELAARAQVVIVIGAAHSSNTARLQELVAQCGRPVHRVDDAPEVQRAWLEGFDTVGLTAGASAPEALVQQVIERLSGWWPGSSVEEFGQPEQVVFGLPRATRHAPARHVATQIARAAP